MMLLQYVDLFSCEIFLELCPAGFGVLLSSVVLSCRLTP